MSAVKRKFWRVVSVSKQPPVSYKTTARRVLEASWATGEAGGEMGVGEGVGGGERVEEGGGKDGIPIDG